MFDASIIIPVYNTKSSDLQRSVNSALCQTCRNIEIIIIDDGSNAEVADECDKLAQSDRRIRVIHQVNSGLSSARNRGVRAALGKWIMFLDSDDWLTNDTIERSVESGDRNDVQLVMSAWVKEYGSHSERFELPYNVEVVFGRKECRELLSGLFDWDSRYHDITGKLFRRGFLEDNNLYHDADVKMGSESLLFNLKVFNKLERASYIPIDTYHYELNDGSISTCYSDAYYEGLITSYVKAKSMVSGYEDHEALEVALRRHIPNVVAAMTVGCLFAPDSSLKWKDACEKAISFRDEMLNICECRSFDYSACSLTRKLVCRALDLRAFILIKLVAFVRFKQKHFGRLRAVQSD